MIGLCHCQEILCCALDLMYPHENAQISRVMFRELREISYFKQKIKKNRSG